MFYVRNFDVLKGSRLLSSLQYIERSPFSIQSQFGLFLCTSIVDVLYYNYIEYHSVSPLVRIGSAHPLSRKRVCPPPGPEHSPANEGVGEPNLDAWRESLAICLLWDFNLQVLHFICYPHILSYRSKVLWSLHLPNHNSRLHHIHQLGYISSTRD